MIVEIFSIHAAVSGMPSGTTWRGECPVGHSGHNLETLERIYRFFNRVDEGDHEAMEAVGYTMPSLSMGDFVTLHLHENGPKGPVERPFTWRVASVGFEEVTGNHEHTLPLR